MERREAPTLWCPQCETAVAQADVEDKTDVPTSFVTLAFPTTDGRQIRIATTRPELLPACVAVFVHPDDQRYADSGRRHGDRAVVWLSRCRSWPTPKPSRTKAPAP